MRRRVGAAVAAVLSAAAMVLPAAAQESDGRWEARWGIDADTVFADEPVVPVSFRHEPRTNQPGIERLSFDVTVEDGELPDGCALPAVQNVEFQPDDGDLPHQVEQQFQFALPCNGRYRATATAVTAAGVPYEAESYVTSIDFAMGAAPSPPRALTVRVDDERENPRARLAWLPPSEAPPDLAGYVVERAKGRRGEFQEVGVADEPKFVDDDVPVGVVRYRVHSSRPGAFADSRILSARPAEASVEVEPPPDPDEQTGNTAGSTSTARPTARFGPRPTVGGPSTQTTVDTGFDPTLDFGDTVPPAGGAPVEAGGDAGSPSDQASGVVQTFEDDEGEGVGLLVPMAVALVFFVGFLQIRYLLRRATR